MAKTKRTQLLPPEYILYWHAADEDYQVVTIANVEEKSRFYAKLWPLLDERKQIIGQEYEKVENLDKWHS